MKEKQIDKQAVEEMAKDIKSSLDGLGCGNFYFTGDEISIMFAKALYNAGYRKQSEGVWTFNQDGSGTCSNCHFTQKGVWDYDNHQHFCGVCGAKMKGGKGRTKNFFSAEDVRKMSPGEVRENYQAIMHSMKEWK